MSSPISRPSSCSRRNLPYPDRLRHAQVGEGVDDGRPNVGFVHLSLEASGEQGVPQLLEPVHHVLGNAASVVSAIVLPAVESLGFNFLEDDVASVVASPRDRTVAWRDGGTRVPLGDCRMAAVAVVGTIGRDLGDLAFDLVEQAGQDFAVAPGGGGHFNADDVLGAFVYGQMDLAPGAALADTVLTHLPFAFAENLQASRIDHHVRRPLTRPARYLHRKLSGPSRHVGVVRHRQVQVTQAHQRLDQSFRGAVRQLEQGLDRQTRLNGRLRVQPGLAASDRTRRRPTVPDARLVEPDRQIASIDQRPVVLRPVRHPIPLLEAHLASLRLHSHCHANLLGHPRPATPGIMPIYYTNAPRSWRSFVERIELIKNRFSSVLLENTSFEKIISRFDHPNYFLYLDPPYVLSSRSEKSGYRKEMTDSQHRLLVNLCLESRSKILISGYENEIYTVLEDNGWFVVSVPHLDMNTKKPRFEVFWKNYSE